MDTFWHPVTDDRRVRLPCGGVLTRLRLAPEATWVEIETQVRSQIVPRTLFGGRWEEHGRGGAKLPTVNEDRGSR
jgi:hypothetical protein